MILPKILHLLLAIQVALASALPTSTDNDETATIGKRGYAIEPAEEGLQLWPPPNPTSNQRWIQYCFWDHNTYDHIFPYFFPALAMWVPAMQYSSLRVRWAKGCEHERCICTDDNGKKAVKEDVLVIYYRGPGVSDCTAGYLQDVPGCQSFGRHVLNFRERDPDPMHPEQVEDARIVEVAHELGHAFGLLHEHERPDIDDWRTPHYDERFRGKDTATLTRLEALPDEKGLEGKKTGFDRLMTIAKSQKLVTEHFSTVASRHQPGRKQSIGASPDFSSIMMYGGRGLASAKFPIIYTMHEKNKPKPELEFYQGGAENPAKASISLGDLKAIAILYPADSSMQAKALALTRWEPIEVCLPIRRPKHGQLPDNSATSQKEMCLTVRQAGTDPAAKPWIQTSLFHEFEQKANKERLTIDR